MKTTAQIVSIQVGLPQMLEDPNAGVWTTGFYKQPVAGPVQFGKCNIQGDGQADLVNHGGIDKAVLAYSADHYEFWNQELGQSLSYGAFGENLTITGLTESDVCLGDVWQIGPVQLEISQPRQPCWKLARRWNRPDLPKRVVQTGRSGWYFRVVKEGETPAGEINLINRPHPDWTITRCQSIYYESSDREGIQELANLPELSQAWRNALKKKIASGQMK